MNQAMDSLKRAVVDGFFIVLPIVLVILLLGEMLDMVSGLVEPLASLAPRSELFGIDISAWLGALVVLAFLLAVGMSARTSAATTLGTWVQDNVLNRLPGYTTIRTLSRRFAGSEASDLFAPALLTMPMDTKVIAFVVEEHDNGDFTVLVPTAPTPMVGTLQHVQRDRVLMLDVPLAKAVDCVMRWGIGSKELFAATRER